MGKFIKREIKKTVSQDTVSVVIDSHVLGSKIRQTIKRISLHKRATYVLSRYHVCCPAGKVMVQSSKQPHMDRGAKGTELFLLPGPTP